MPKTYKGFGKYIVKGYALSILLLLAWLLVHRLLESLEAWLALSALLFAFVALPVWLIMDARGIRPPQFYRDRKWRG